MSLLKAQKTRDAALLALGAAKTPKDRAAAIAALDKASLAVARAAHAAGVRSEEEPKKDEKSADEEEDDEPKKPLQEEDSKESASMDEDEESKSDSMDESASAEEEDDSEKSMDEDESMDESASADAAEDDESKDSPEEDEDAEEEERAEEEEDDKARALALSAARSVYRAAKKSKNASVLKAARANLRAARRASKPKAAASAKQLRAVAARVTGKKSAKAILGALEAIPATTAQQKKLAADVAKIKHRAKIGKIDSLLAANKGRYAPAEKAGLRETAVTMGVRWLRANLEARPKVVRSIEDGAVVGKTLEGSTSASVEKITLDGLSAEQAKAIQAAADDAGKSVEDFLADMNKQSARIAARRHANGVR